MNLIPVSSASLIIGEIERWAGVVFHEAHYHDVAHAGRRSERDGLRTDWRCGVCRDLLHQRDAKCVYRKQKREDY